MNPTRRPLYPLAVAATLCLATATAHAAALLDEASLLGDVHEPATRSFDVTTPGTYDFRLTDLAFPQTLGSAQALLTRGSTSVATLAAPGLTEVTLAAGPHQALIAAVPKPVDGYGTFGVTLKAVLSGATPLDFSDDARKVAAASASLQTTRQTTFTVTTAGTYHVALTDLAFPAALVRRDVLLTSAAGAVVLALTGGTTAGDAVLAAGNYNVVVVGEADATAKAGLYALSVSGSGGTPYAQVHSIGQLDDGVDVTLPVAADYTLTLTDLAAPRALSSLRAMVTQGTATLAKLDAAGAASFPAAAGTARLFVLQAAASGSTTGASFVRVAGSSTVFETVDAVSPALDSADEALFVEPATLASAGTYVAELVDFDFPAAASAPSLYVVQGGHVVAQRSGAGTVDVVGVAGPAYLLVAATPSALTHASLVETRLLVQPAGTVLLEKTRSLGISLQSRTVDVATAGSYDLTLTDLRFPGALSDVAVAVTRSNVRVASVYGSGTVRFDATGGRLDVHVLARTADASGFGSYGIKLDATPAAPAITFGANPATVRQGETVDLTWSVTGATTCTASDGWSGARALTGTTTSAALNVDSRFTLTCVGAGGSTAHSLDVRVKADDSGGGGGSNGAALLALLAGLGLRRTRQSSSRTSAADSSR